MELKLSFEEFKQAAINGLTATKELAVDIDEDIRFVKATNPGGSGEGTLSELPDYVYIKTNRT